MFRDWVRVCPISRKLSEQFPQWSELPIRPVEVQGSRYACAHLKGMFPNLPGQSGWGKRVWQSTGLLSAVITELARDTSSWNEVTRLVDSTPLPCAASRETVKRSDVVGHAGHGYCASHSRFFWGFRLYLLCTPDGMPVIWGLANPKIGEREATEALLRHDRHLIAPGQVIVGDKGFAGRKFESFITDELGAHLIRPDRKDENPRFGKLGGIRQWVESVFDTLKEQLTLEEHGGRTVAGVYSRVADRVLALAAGIWHNWLTNAPRRTIPHRLRPLKPNGPTHLVTAARARCH